MITVIVGPNEYDAGHLLGERIRAFQDEHGKESVVRLDGEEVEIEDIRAAVKEVSLFSPTTLVVVKGASQQKALHEPLLSFISEVGEAENLLLYEPTIDKRSALFKQLKKQGDFNEFKARDEHSLLNWVQTKVAAFGGEISPADAQFLIIRAGENQWDLHHEIEKLVLQDKTINRTTITELVEPVPRETVFQMLDAAMSGHEEQAIKIYNELRFANQEPHYILGMIAWQLHNMSVVVFSKSKRADEIASRHKMSPFVVNKTLQATRSLNKNDIRELLRMAADTDVKIKTTAIDADQAVAVLIRTISRKLSS